MPVITHNTKLILWPRGSYIECDLYCGIVGGIVLDMDLHKPNITLHSLDMLKDIALQYLH